MLAEILTLIIFIIVIIAILSGFSSVILDLLPVFIKSRLKGWFKRYFKGGKR